MAADLEAAMPGTSLVRSAGFSIVPVSSLQHVTPSGPIVGAGNRRPWAQPPKAVCKLAPRSL